MQIEIGMPMQIFLAMFLLIWFGFSIYSVIIWLQFSPKLKQVLNDVEKHWSIKYVIYYGISFSIFLVACVFVSFIVILSNFLSKGL